MILQIRLFFSIFNISSSDCTTRFTNIALFARTPSLVLYNCIVLFAGAILSHSKCSEAYFNESDFYMHASFIIHHFTIYGGTICCSRVSAAYLALIVLVHLHILQFSRVRHLRCCTTSLFFH